MIVIGRYPFGVKILKETLGFLLIEPAVPGALEEFTVSGFKSVFLSAEI